MFVLLQLRPKKLHRLGRHYLFSQCYRDWSFYLLTHLLLLCTISHSACVELFLIVLFVPLLQRLEGIFWNRRQCFDSEINNGKKCSEAHLYDGEVVCHPKEAKQRSKHLCLQWDRWANLLLSNLNICKTKCVLCQVVCFASHCRRHLTTQWTYNP